jgi:glucokinase
VATSDCYLGLEIGGTKLQLVAGGATGAIARRWRHAVDPSSGAEGIRGRLAEWLPEAIAEFAPRAFGVGFGGPVDWRKGRLARSHQIAGWSDFPLHDWLQNLSGIPVRIDNDANVAALAEARCGHGRGLPGVFYVTLGSGVGGGLVVHERIYHGAAPGESEIGHLRLDKAGTLVEERCSGWAVDRRIRECVRQHPGGALASLVGDLTSGEARFLRPALEQGDPLAHAILSEVADNLAFALSHVVHMVHPECIILGGGLSLVGDLWRDAVASAIRPYLMEVFLPGPPILLARLGEDAVPVGALLLAAE